MAQAPMHSPSLSVTRPSALVSLKPFKPSFCFLAALEDKHFPLAQSRRNVSVPQCVCRSVFVCHHGCFTQRRRPGNDGARARLSPSHPFGAFANGDIDEGSFHVC